MLIAMMGMMLGRPFGIRMYSCRNVVEMLGDYINGELPANEMRSIALHVMACPDCQNFLATYRQTGEMTRGIRYEDIPEDFIPQLEKVLLQRLRGG